MIPDDQLDQRLHAFRAGDIPEGPSPELVSRTLAALHAETSHPTETSRLASLFHWSKPMPPFLRLAATFLIVAGTTGLVGVISLSRNGPGVAFADALEHVRDARTITYTMRIGDDPALFRVFRKEPGLTRTEAPGGSITIMDRPKGQTLLLNPATKQATRLENKTGSPTPGGDDQIDLLRQFQGKPEQQLGEQIINNRPARGFQLSAGGWTSQVWVDTETNHPVRLEIKTRFNAEVTKTVVFSDLVFDAPLDDSLFQMTVPEGYQAQSLPLAMDLVPPTEKNLVDLFGEYAKRSGGRFPNDLQVPSLIDVLKDINVSKTGLDETTNAWIAKVGKGVGLVWAMPPDSDAYYAGKGVQLGQVDTPIFWYRPQKSRTYRVIYGDLMVRDVEPNLIPDPKTRGNLRIPTSPQN